jgi:hypothetical protein
VKLMHRATDLWSKSSCLRAAGGLWLAALLGPLSLCAQDLPESFGQPNPDPDFLFEPPRFSIGGRGGLFFHGAGSDLFDFTEEQFTIDRCIHLAVDTCAFRGISFGVEGGVWLGPRMELTLGLDGSRVTLDSEYRERVEDDGSAEGHPIRQTTRLGEGPVLSVGARWYVADRGEQLGQFVWVPRSWNAFLSGGGGVTGYELALWGDFDDVDALISTERFTSSGHAFFPFLGAGVEYGVSDRTALTIEARYLWARDDLGVDFDRDFVEPLDLSGARLTLGLFYRN